MTSIEHRIHFALRVAEASSSRRGDCNHRAVTISGEEVLALSREAQAHLTWTTEPPPVGRVLSLWVLAREALGLDIPAPEQEDEGITFEIDRGWPGEHR